MKKYVVCMALVCALFLSSVALGAAAKIGEEAPDFKLLMLSGDTFRLSEQRGKVVYLNLWATWCPPCVAEMGDIQKLYEAHPDDLYVIGASVDEDSGTVKKFLDENGYSYPVGMDADYTLVSTLYPSQYIPLSVFISPNGIVTYMDVGVLTYELMEALYQDALEK